MQNWATWQAASKSSKYLFLIKCNRYIKGVILVNGDTWSQHCIQLMMIYMDLIQTKQAWLQRTPTKNRKTDHRRNFIQLVSIRMLNCCVNNEVKRSSHFGDPLCKRIKQCYWHIEFAAKTREPHCYTAWNNCISLLFLSMLTQMHKTSITISFGILQIQQVQLQWTSGIYKWKLQTKIFLIVPLLQIELANIRC